MITDVPTPDPKEAADAIRAKVDELNLLIREGASVNLETTLHIMTEEISNGPIIPIVVATCKLPQ